MIGWLTTLPILADRVEILERLGSYSLGPLQYVDDTSTPCPSVGAVRAVLGPQPLSACSKYARRMRAVFNYGPGKTACLPMFGNPCPDEEAIGCDVVRT